MIDRVREQLIALLALEGCRFEYRSLLGHPPRAGASRHHRGRRDVEQQGLPAEEIELRVFGNG